MKNDNRDSSTKPDNEEQKSAQESWLIDDDNFTELLHDYNLADSEKSNVIDPIASYLTNIPFKLSSPFSLKSSLKQDDKHLSNVTSELLPESSASSNWTEEKTLQTDDIDTKTGSLIKLDTNERFLLDRFPFEIGRSPECQLQIANMSLSRQHVKIDKSETGLTIMDLGSANGVQVNSVDVKQVLLMDGDTIRLGNIDLRFDLMSNDLICQKSGQSLMKKVGLSHANWKIIAAAGCIGLPLLGSFLYQFLVDDRLKNNDQSPVTATPTTSPIVTTKKRVNHSPESVFRPNKNTLPNKAAQSRVTLDNSDQNKPILDNASAKKIVKAEQTVALPEKISTTKSESMLVAEPAPISSHGADSSPTPKKRPVVTAESLINKALQFYQEGQVSKAVSLLGGLSISSKISIKSQNQAANLESKLTSLENNYQEGEQAYSKGNKTQAWEIWKTFLSTEKNLQLPSKSKYALTIQQRVKEESLARGNALEKKDSKAANRHLQRAALLETDNQASRANAELLTKVRLKYSEGVRLEQSDLSKAIMHWREVTRLAPPSNEYYIKAKAKLRFYEEMVK